MFDFFSKAAPAEAPAAAPVQPAAPGAPQPADTQLNKPPEVTTVETPGTDANGVVPNNVNDATSPLDEFKGLWETDPNAKPAEVFTPQTLDATKLQEVISKTNLTSVITPEIQARINAGGEDANVALNEAMNLVAQSTLMQSTTVANKMMESQTTKMMEAVKAMLPNLVKEQSFNNSLVEQNPIFSNPAVAPVLDGVKSQLQVKYPNATAPELTTMAQKFIVAMGESFAPQPTEVVGVDREYDFSNFLEESKI